MSVDQADRQKEFDDENELGFPLLADPSKNIIDIFGVKRFGFLPAKRATFVIGTDRIITAAITSETSMNRHADEALVALGAAQPS